MDAIRAVDSIVADPMDASGIPAEEIPSFVEIYERYVDFVWSSLRGLGIRPAAIEDAVQEVFVALHRRLPDFERRSTLKTFLFGIVVGVARNQRRSARRDGLLDPLTQAPAVADVQPSPLDHTVKTEALERFAGILDRLDETKREVLLLAEWEELPAPEIASMLGINVNTVYSRLRLAREEFNRHVERDRRRGL
jgi:RNA polymerase sigma-70 factor (ECF subfamily)